MLDGNVLQFSDFDVLTQVRDVETVYRLHSGSRLRCRLSGMITRVNRRGGICFFRFRDATGSIQVVVERSSCDLETWGLVAVLKLMDRVLVFGDIALTRPPHNVLSVFLRECKLLIPRRAADRVDNLDPAERGLTAQVFLARLRKQATGFFEEHEYVELEPSFLASYAPSTSIEPLRVVFPGYGADALLAPSPAMQLMEALLLTGYSKLFSVSRCFSAVVRDGYTSAESLILSALILGADLQEVLRTIQDAVTTIFKHFTTVPIIVEDDWLNLTPWNRQDGEWSESKRSVHVPTIQVDHGNCGDSSTVAVQGPPFRVVWPPDIVVVEGGQQLLDERIRICAYTLHLERMVSVLRDVNLYRLRPRNSLVQ